MTYDELIEILNAGAKDDWCYDDAHGVFAYKHDLHLRIVRSEPDGFREEFRGEDWATRFPDPTAYRVNFEVYYGATFVTDALLVAVDGYRAVLPLPDAQTTSVQRSRYNFARIVDITDSLEEYMRRADLTVQG